MPRQKHENKILLFDIDHTLLESGGAGFRAMNRAFSEVYGVDDATRGIVPDGKTDPMLLREAIAAMTHAPEDGEAAIHQLTELYLRLLPQEMTTPPARLMPGVPELLAALSTRRSVLLGLLTGNFQPTAYVKLEVFGLDGFFDFGAFGSDSSDRIELPPIAVARAEELTGQTIGLGPHVVIIGDTQRDIHCALAWGATAVGVATGRSTVDELRNAGAHHVFEDLSDTDVVLRVLGEPRNPGSGDRGAARSAQR
jgi:phosphoglycolate phosphatase-like HAD superfamily hydrolase